MDPLWKEPGSVDHRITLFAYRVKMDKSVITINHDRMKKCEDRKVTAWLKRAHNRLKTAENVLDTESENVWCLFWQGNNGEFMIQCDF